MHESLVIERMSGDLVLWRCLHGGPLTRDNIDSPEPHPQVPWETIRARNIPLLRKLAAVYGTYAIVAREGDRLVGQLRFYPKAISDMSGGGGVCLQQLPPAGPEDDLAAAEFPPLEALAEKALAIHCMQVAEEYRGRRIGPALIERLVAWAREGGWEAIHAQAIRHIVPLLHWTGMASAKHLGQVGFVVRSEAMLPELKEGVVSQRQGYHGAEVQAMWQAYAELSDDEAATVFQMVLDLRAG